MRPELDGIGLLACALTMYFTCMHFVILVLSIKCYAIKALYSE